MPISIATARDPFRGVAPPAASAPALRLPQARVLAALMPDDPADPPSEWPARRREALARRAGFTAVSGSTNRALKGIPDTGNKTGDPHPGLLALGYAEEVVHDVCGLTELAYRITAAGIAAYRAWIAAGNSLERRRDKAASVNTRRGYANPHR